MNHQILQRKELFYNEKIIPPVDFLSNEIYLKTRKSHADTLPPHLQKKLEALKERKGKAVTILDRVGRSDQDVSLYQPANNSLYANVQPPKWHPPWKLMRVILGHTGWVRSIAMDPENQWFATGSTDCTIKLWDLASGTLKLTLTGHIMSVRGLVVSPRHPYLFSCSEDKTIRCWDLERNKMVRDYYGHLSSVYSVDMHPTLDILASGGKDSVVRVWDVRTRVPVHVIPGHKSSITNVKCRDSDPQIVSTSLDGTIRTYDLVAGKTMSTLTHHKKGVRGLTFHKEENSFATGSTDNIKQWKLPDCEFIQNFSPQHNAMVNTLSNNGTVLFSGADNGSMAFFDWESGHKFQETYTKAVPGSLESERGIFASSFDLSGLRLITCEGDKSIKVWKEDPDATEKNAPGLPWNP